MGIIYQSRSNFPLSVDDIRLSSFSTYAPTIMLATVSVLGKRKASVSESKGYVLHLNSSPEPQTALSESEYEPEASSSKKPVIINGKLISGTTKWYQCTVEGCGKAYSKPSRLEEHSRSHTGIVSVNNHF